MIAVLVFSFFAIPLVFTSSYANRDCGSYWQKYDGKCYRFITHRGTYKDSQQWCSGYGGHLVRVDGPRENYWLTLQMRIKNLDELWIGATDIANEGRFVWESNSLPLMNKNFATRPWRQPDNRGGKEHCVHIRKTYHYKWNDEPCHSKFYSVCEK